MTENPELREQINRVIRQAMDDSPSADPTSVAGVVVDRLNAKQAREALTMTMPTYVRHTMSRYGWKARSAARRPMTKPEMISNWYAQITGASMCIDGVWKFLRDCTADDLHVAAKDRYQKATEVHAEGDRWTKLALFMEENDRSTVATIREDELKTLMES